VDEKLRAALDAIELDWNEAEEYIKKVERLRRGLVVTASINELRYAGRRLVEAYSLAKKAELDPQYEQTCLDLLREVRSFCLRAKHDAIDGAVTYIDQALAKFEEEFGPDLLHEKFDDYVKMKVALREVSEIMSQSRGGRDNRNELYKKISEEIISGLITHHYTMETSKVVFSAEYKVRVKREKRDASRFLLPFVVAIAGVAVALVAAVAAILALPPFEKYLVDKPSAASAPSKPSTQGAPKPHQGSDANKKLVFVC
jgi:hypothetical protein